MNEEYLQGLHGYLGIEDDYETWINAIKDNEEYLQGLHNHLGIEDDYETWSTAVMGGVKKKDEGMDLPLADGFSDSQETEVTEEVVTQQTPTDDTQEWKVRYESVFGINPDEYGVEEEEGTNQLGAYEIQQQEGIKLHDRLKPPTDRYSEAIDEVGRILNTTNPKESVELLDRLFKDSGFSFEQEGVEVKMIAPNKNELVVQTKKRMKPSRFGLPISPIMQKHLHTATDQQTIQDFYETNRPQEEYNPNVAVSAKDLDNMVFSFRNAEDALIKESLALQEEGNTFRQDPRHYWNPYKIKQNPVEYKEFLAQRQEIKNQAEDLDARWKKLEEDRLKVMDMEKERNEMLAFTDYSDKKNYGDKFLADFAGVGSGSNFFGRMWHAAALGRGQSGSVDELGKVWTQVFYGKANEVSEDDINNMREAMKEAQQYGPSETMQNWYTRMNKYREEGSPGLLAMVRATAADPESLPDLMATSFAMLTNPYIMKRGAAAFSAVHGVATGVGAFGSAPGVGITNIAALPWSIPTAMLSMTATLETTLTFGQLLEEELGGIDNMTVENVQRLFNNEYKMKRFVNRSLGRGIAIGAVEAFAMALGIKVAPRVANMMGAGMRGKMASMTTVSGIEVLGGSLGEVAGMTMAGQPRIAEDIYLEGIGALWNAPITYGVGMAYSPKYKVNGQEWTAADFNKWINDPETSQDAIAGATIDIKNDNAMARFVEQKKATAFKEGVIAKSLDPITENLPKAAREKLVRLEMELQDLKEKGEGTETSKIRIKEIKDEIRIINEGAKGTQIFEATFTDEQGNEVKERVEVSEEYAIEQLKKDGIDTPTSEQIKTKQQELVDQGIRELKEQYKGVEQTQLTAKEKEVADLLGLDLSGTETTEDVTERFQVTDKEQVKNLSTAKKQIVTQAENIVKALKTAFPDVKVVVHADEKTYSKHAPIQTKGRFDDNTNTIHINLTKADNTTVAHEAFHAVLLNSIKTDKETTIITNKMLKAVDKSLGKGSKLKSLLTQFAQEYDVDIQSEEQLAQLIGVLAANYKTLSKPETNIILQWLKELGQKLGFSMDFINQLTRNEEAVIDLLNTLSTKFSQGEAIVKEDTQILYKMSPKKLNFKQYLKRQNRNQQQTVAAQDFNLDELEVISKGGTGRIVYQHPTDKNKVIKVATSPRGLEQNLSVGFGDFNMLDGKIAELFEQGLDYIVVEKVPRNDKVVNKYLKGLKSAYRENGVDRFGNVAPIVQDYMEAKGLTDFLNYNLLWNDFLATRNWGVRADGEVVLVDEGALNNRVYYGSEIADWAKQEWEDVKRKRRGPLSRDQQKDVETTKPQEWRFRDQKVGTEATLFDYVRAGKLGNVSTKDLISVLVKKGIGHTNIKQQLIDSGIKKPTLKQIQKKQREEIKKILKISDKELTNLPSVFGSLNIGPVAGNRLFKSLTREKKGKPVLTIEQALEKLRSSQAYKNATDSQKTEMETAVRAQHELGTPREMTDRIKEARHLIRDLDSYRSLQDFKRKLKTFIRKALPLDVLKTNKRVEELLAKIDKIKHSDLDTITEEIIEEVNTINSRTLNRDIDTALKDLSKKNKPLSSKIKKWISAVDPSASIKSILAEVDKLMKLRAELEANQESLSPSQIDEMLAIRAAENIVLSYTMRENQIDNVSSLSTALQLLQELGLVEGTRQKLEAQETHERYNRQRETILTAILGKKVDLSTKKGRKAVADAIKVLKNKKGIKRITKKVVAKTTWEKTKDHIITFLTSPVASAQDLHGLMAIIDKMPGELFGGVAKELVVDLVNRGTREFKKRSMMVDDMIEAEMIRLWGKDRSIKTLGKKRYITIVRDLNKKSVFLYKTKNGEAKVQEAEKKFEDGEITKDELMEFSSKYQVEQLSQAELAYLYMHYKNKETHPAFKAKFGRHTDFVMEEVNKKIDPKLKEFSDWQMDVLFPQLYEHYNIAYRDLYRTDMPQVQRYGGRLYRDNFMPSDDFVDLIAVKVNPNASVFAASINERTDSKSPILITSSINSLFSYVNNMEYFAAMGRPVRDINKMFTNKDVRDAIVTLHGQETYDMIKDMIQKIANRGVRQGDWDVKLNKFNTAMTVGSLSIRPTVMFKQLVSFIAYANAIGYVNWMRNFVLPFSPQWNRLSKEINDNSVYIQHRYRQSIVKSLETMAAMAEDTRFESSALKGVLNDLIWAVMLGVRLGDYGAIIFGGMANYKFHKAEAQAKGLTGQDAIDYAIRKFEDDTKSTQQSGDIQEKDYFQTSDAVTRGLNMFMTSPKQYLRKELTAIKNIHSIYKGEGAQGSFVENMRTLITYHVILPAFFQYITAGLPGLMRPWRDDDWKDFARVAVIGNLNAFFILGDLFNLIGDALTEKPWTGTTKQVGLISIAIEIGKELRDLRKIDKEKNPEKYEKQLVDFISKTIMLSGIPAPSAVAWKRNFQAIIEDPTMDEGEIILRILNWSPYQITGPRTREAQQRWDSIKTPYNYNRKYHY